MTTTRTFRTDAQRLVVPLVAGALLAGGASRLVRSDPPPADPPLPEDVLEAAFRQQVHEVLDPEARARGTVVCLRVDPGGAPQSVTREFLLRFRGEPSVRRAAECEARP